MKNFTIEAEDTTFNFNSLNRRKLQLFQVYVTLDGVIVRFHMQIDEQSGEFYIVDKNHCPEIYLKAEKILSDAIKIYGVAEKVPT